MKLAQLSLLACLPIAACGAATGDDASVEDSSSMTASGRVAESTTGSSARFDSDGRPIVGRLKMRDETLPLTTTVVQNDRRLDTMQAARVMADIDRDLSDKPNEPNLP